MNETSTTSFDPNEFMQQTIDSPMEIDIKLPTEGEYKAIIGDFDASAFERFEFTYSKGPNAGLPGSMTKFNCPFVINDPKLVTAIGREETTVRKPITLDFDKSGKLDFGVNRNIDLGRVRAAVDQNNSGPWTFSQLRGAGPIMVKVIHRRGKRKDGTDFHIAEVDRVVKIT